ncbi:MAG: TetR/AcrR family transcriptional regulator [Devosia sp.]
MGHKEDLLAGAKECLIEIGYAKTTARDIVAVSKTNLASIGYHYGSLDALMTQAMIEMVGDWGEKFAAASSEQKAKGTEAKFRAVWRQLLKLFETDGALLLASFEIGVAASRSDPLKAIFATAYADVRKELPEDFMDAEALDPKTRRAVGSLLLAIISGMTIQYLLDPEGTPTADELTLAMKTVAKAFVAKG